MRDDNLHTERDLAAKLSAQLPGWSVAERRSHGEVYGIDLARADGARIHISVGGFRNEGRVAFYGCDPKYADGTPHWSGKRNKITCAASRSPAMLAKEIMRRLLPVYLPDYARALEYVRAQDAHQSEAEMVASRIATAIGGDKREGDVRRKGGVDVWADLESVRRLRIVQGHTSDSYSRDISVDFEVHGLDPETALAVLELIRSAEQKGPRVGVRLEADQLDEPVEDTELAEHAPHVAMATEMEAVR